MDIQITLINQINEGFIRNGWSISKPLAEFDTDYLSEDLAQYYKSNVIIDFGFYGDGTEEHKGEFVIYIVENKDWENYIAKYNFKYRKDSLNILSHLPEIWCLSA